MVSPLDLRCWFGYFAWMGFAFMKLVDAEIDSLFIWLGVLFIGMFFVFLVLNKIFPDAPESNDSEEVEN